MVEPIKYSAEWIKQQVDEKGATELLHHDCGFCGYWVRYLFYQDGGVEFASACNCSWSPPRVSFYEDIANWLAMQRNDEVRDRIMARLES